MTIPLPGSALHFYLDDVANALPGDQKRVVLSNLNTIITGTNPPTQSVSLISTTTDQQLTVGAGYIRGIRLSGTAGVAQEIVLYDTASGPGGTEIYRMACETGTESIDFTVGITFNAGLYVTFETINATSVYIEWSTAPGSAIFPASGNRVIVRSSTGMSDSQLYIGSITVKRVSITAPGGSASTFALTLYDTASGPGGAGVINLGTSAPSLTQYYLGGLRFNNGIYMDVATNAPYSIYIEYAV